MKVVTPDGGVTIALKGFILCQRREAQGYDIVICTAVNVRLEVALPPRFTARITNDAELYIALGVPEITPVCVELRE